MRLMSQPDPQPDASTLDGDGYRRNVGIVLCNSRRQVFWARRVRHDGWQFPQGGMRPAESAEQALFRELNEEVGLDRAHVRVVGRTRDWLRYDLPPEYRRHRPQQPIRGQKQLWFLLELLAPEHHIRLDGSERPEFDDWRWVDYWSPLEAIVEFKRGVYRDALEELALLAFPDRP
jgi:putative (di)nucleoside polyphosphate hydrolase